MVISQEYSIVRGPAEYELMKALPYEGIPSQYSVVFVLQNDVSMTVAIWSAQREDDSSEDWSFIGRVDDLHIWVKGHYSASTMQGKLKRT